jgi:hypothetical protein
MTSMDDYLQRLTDRLADGLARVPEPVCNRHVDFLRAAQNPDGGFSGRDGGSDLTSTTPASPCAPWPSSTLSRRTSAAARRPFSVPA